MARILLADDEPYITAIVSMKFRKAGHAVEVVDDGGRAWDALTNPAGPGFDLLVTDYQMPVLSGFELCERLKVHPRAAFLPVVMLTGRGHRLGEAELARTNVRHLMAKPFSVKELLEKAESLLAPCVMSRAA